MTDQEPISVYCIVNDSEEDTMAGIIADFDSEWSCGKCRHIIRKDLSCAAFPAGIPEDILDREFDHRKPYPHAKNPEDSGIRFEAVEEYND